MPVGGGGAWPDNTQIPQPIGGRREACGAWLDNEPTRRAKLAVRTAEAGGTDTTASQISHAIPPQHESTQAQKSQNINDQNPNPDMRPRELHAKLLVDSHSWASGRRAEPHVNTHSSPAAHPAPPVPKQPAGPQATASATQQHVVSYNPVSALSNGRYLYSPRHTHEFPSRLNRGVSEHLQNRRSPMSGRRRGDHPANRVSAPSRRPRRRSWPSGHP